jgi:two-component system, NarL family, response regulator NreC
MSIPRRSKSGSGSTGKYISAVSLMVASVESSAKVCFNPAVYWAPSQADLGTYRVSMSQNNCCIGIKPSLVAAFTIGVRARSGVQPAWLSASLSLFHPYRYTTPVHPRSPVARYTVVPLQGCVDIVRSISTGLTLHNVLTFAELGHQCSCNRLAPDYPSRDRSASQCRTHTEEKNVPKIRILLVDNHTVVRVALRMFIDAQPDMEVVGEAQDSRTALAKALETKPDVTLMDIDMPGTSGITAIEQLLRVCPRTRILVFTTYNDLAYARSALAAGGLGYVTKQAEVSDLLTGIRSVYQGCPFVDPILAGHLLKDLLGKEANGQFATPGTPWSLLSPREREVLILLAQGYTNRQVAEQIGVSIKTVATHRAHIIQKLELSSRVDLTRYALKSGLITPNTFLDEGSPARGSGAGARGNGGHPARDLTPPRRFCQN